MQKTRIQPLDNYVLRTPLFSIDRLDNFFALADGDRSLFSTEELQMIDEAIYLASPTLFSEWKRMREGELTDKAETKKIRISLMKYFQRMCTRCTPFGLFAGCTTGSFGEGNITLDSHHVFNRNTRLDMHYVCSLAQEWSKLDAVQKNIKYYPNSSVYVLGDQVRYVNYQYKGKTRVHNISAVENNYFLDKVLKKASQGCFLWELMDCITEEGESQEDAEAFVKELLILQLLVNELEPSVTGEEFMAQMKKVLIKASQNTEVEKDREILNRLCDELTRLTGLVEEIDQKVGNGLDVYERLHQEVERINVPYEASKLVQTDLYSKSVTCQLPETVGDEVKNGLLMLNRFTKRYENANLKSFRDRFQKRYGSARVPLLQALDVESGVGYLEGKDGDSSPIIQNVPFGMPGGESKLSWDPMQSFLLRKLREASKEEAFEVVLKDEDFKNNEPNWSDGPETISIMLRHLGKKDGQDVLFFGSAGGSSASNLLGRFAHGSPGINQLVHEIAEREKANRSDKALAEIVHLPQARTGNILMRPVIRDYEIPYLAQPAVSQDRVIAISDLSVSIVNGRIILYSEKLQKEVEPHLSTAHNYSSNALPVYQFLCDMQHHQKRNGYQFSWGVHQSEFKFLPRLRYGNIIFSLAKWTLFQPDFEAFVKAHPDKLVEEATLLRESQNLPEKVVLAEGDNELYVDLTNQHSLEVFRDTIKRRPSIKLVEFGYDIGTPVVTNKSGEAYTNQMVVVFEKIEEANEVSPVKLKSIPADPELQKTKRTFFTGDEWLYYKLYCGVKTADSVLTESIAPLTQKLKKEGLIDGWFFLRYSDPDKHLRLRLHVPNTQHLGKVITRFYEHIEPWLESGEVWNLTCDSYVRELERYGTQTMELCEEIFYHDSEAILNSLQLHPDERSRWLFAVRMIDTLMSDFGFNDDQKEELMGRMKDAFAREFNASKQTKKSLAKKYREVRNHIEKFLTGEVNGNRLHNELHQIITQKSKRIKAPANTIRERIEAGSAGIELNELMVSLIHMLMNRIFRSRQRMHEMVLYDFIHVTYKSQNARARKMKKQRQTETIGG